MRLAASAPATPPAVDQIIRFAIVGGASTLLYFFLTMTLKGAVGTFAATSAIAYLVCGVLSFFGHRAFTFASRGALIAEASRFAALNLAGLVVALAVPVIADRLGLPSLFAVIIICVIAPAANYLAMRSLVFYRLQRDERTER